MINFYDIFISNHGEPNNKQYLYDYISFVKTHNIVEKSECEYYEFHHILPRSTFPAFINDKENIVLLKYEDHIKAHELLFYAYNFRVYQRPLNYFKSNYRADSKTRECVSNASKKGWQTLKNNDKKYQNWKKKRSEYMSSLSTEEQQRRSRLGWDNKTDEKRKEFSDKMKSVWTKEKREEWSKKIAERYKDEEYKNKVSISLKKRYKDKQYKEKFDRKMNIVNKDENKRKKAGESIKQKWKDPDFVAKMKNRKTHSKCVKIINSTNEEIIFNSMKKCCEYYNISMYILRQLIKNNCKNIPESLKNCTIIYGKN